LTTSITILEEITSVSHYSPSTTNPYPLSRPYFCLTAYCHQKKNHETVFIPVREILNNDVRTDPKPPPNNLWVSKPELQLADLFSGVGGFSEGFEAAGFKAKLAVDKDLITALTYEVRNVSFSFVYVSPPDNRKTSLKQRSSETPWINFFRNIVLAPNSRSS
jgi:hypothetical protein